MWLGARSTLHSVYKVSPHPSCFICCLKAGSWGSCVFLEWMTLLRALLPKGAEQRARDFRTLLQNRMRTLSRVSCALPRSEGLSISRCRVDLVSPRRLDCPLLGLPTKSKSLEALCRPHVRMEPGDI